MEMLLCFSILFSIAVLFHSVPKLIIFMSVFFPLRTYTNGIHLKHFLSCLIMSCMVMVGAFYLPHLEESALWGCGCLEGFELVAIYFVSKETTKEFDIKEQMYFLKQRKRILMIILIISFLFCLVGLEEYFCVYLYGVTITLLSLLIKVLLQKVQRRKSA